MVEKCFEESDVDGNGSLDFDEFKSAVLQHQVVASVLPASCARSLSYQIVVQSFWTASL